MDDHHFDAVRQALRARLAQAAYLPAQQARVAAAALGFRRFQAFDARGTEGFAASDGSEVALVFRGTEPAKLEDLLVDADARLVNATATEGRVHAGFLRAYAWARQEAWAAVQATGKELPLVCIGHSLGGALATLAAAEAHLHTDARVSLVTIGSPRVGDGEFCRALEEQLAGEMERIVCGLDVIPRVPTRIRGFDHVRRAVYIAADGALHLGASAWDLVMLRIMGGAEALRQPGIAWLADHAAANYVSRLTFLSRVS